LQFIIRLSTTGTSALQNIPQKYESRQNGIFQNFIGEHAAARTGKSSQ
jgi:hypothetical protein